MSGHPAAILSRIVHGSRPGSPASASSFLNVCSHDPQALFFEDPDPVAALQKAFPLYAHHFPDWSEHTSAWHCNFVVQSLSG
jgi:predicted oxidoreductase (fatty acid repression mutant protein)